MRYNKPMQFLIAVLLLMIFCFVQVAYGELPKGVWDLRDLSPDNVPKEYVNPCKTLPLAICSLWKYWEKEEGDGLGFEEYGKVLYKWEAKREALKQMYGRRQFVQDAPLLYVQSQDFWDANRPYQDVERDFRKFEVPEIPPLSSRDPLPGTFDMPPLNPFPYEPREYKPLVAPRSYNFEPSLMRPETDQEKQDRLRGFYH